jgi:hypothetical protein
MARAITYPLHRTRKREAVEPLGHIFGPGFVVGVKNGRRPT